MNKKLEKTKKKQKRKEIKLGIKNLREVYTKTVKIEYDIIEWVRK